MMSTQNGHFMIKESSNQIVFELLVGLLQSPKVHRVRCRSEISHRSFLGCDAETSKKTAVFVRSFGYSKLFIIADLADPDCFDPLVPCCFTASRNPSSFLMAGAARTISTGGTSFQYSRAASVRSLDHRGFTLCEFLNHQLRMQPTSQPLSLQLRP